MDALPQDLAATVRAEVARRRISQEAICAATGHNQRAVSRRLLGQVKLSIADVDAIARLLDMSLDELLSLARRDAEQAS